MISASFDFCERERIKLIFIYLFITFEVNNKSTRVECFVGLRGGIEALVWIMKTLIKLLDNI